MKVVHIQRKPYPGYFSVERVFSDIRSAMTKNINVSLYVSPLYSKGVWRRIYNMIAVIWNQRDINHIAGDVHFLSYFIRGKKTVLTILDCIPLEKNSGFRYWVFWFFWYWIPCQRCAVITVISESTKKELLKHLPSQNYSIEVIPCCVSCEFQPVRKDFNQQKPRILQIGTNPNKNLEGVIFALHGITCKLVIVGNLSSQQLNILEKYNTDFENYTDIDNEDLLKQYHQADLVMFASVYEGFGLPILEAQAVGRPVITSNLYSMPEVGGRGAVYVDPYDISQITAAVEKIIHNDEYRKEIVEGGFKNVQSYTPKVIAEKYADIYRKMHQNI